MKKINILIFFIFIGFFYSCETMKDYDTQYSPTYPISGEWWVTYKVGGADVNGGYSKLLTYNTAANTPDSVWVTDITSADGTGSGNFWTFKCKSAAHMASNSFDVNTSLSKPMDWQGNTNIGVTIKNGKIIKNAATTTAGNKSDSIYFEIYLSDDSPAYGTKYVCTGYRRTGFQADDH